MSVVEGMIETATPTELLARQQRWPHHCPGSRVRSALVDVLHRDGGAIVGVVTPLNLKAAPVVGLDTV